MFSSHLNRYAIASLFASALLLAACATSPTGRSQLLLFPDAQVDALGVASFDDIKQNGKIDSNPKDNQYVSCIANAITATLQPPYDGGWEVVVFNDDSANAFALPGKKIGVHTGIMKVATTPDQLAAVIGHEIGHVMAKHSAERMSIQFASSTGQQLLGAVLANSQEQAAVIGALGAGLLQYGVVLPFSRTHESEADHIGLILMAQAGFQPAASIDLWHNMAAASNGAPPEFLSTHPSHQTRIDQLQELQATAQPLYQQALSQGRKPNCRRG